jgi:addiction module RelE/StbE family toxin
MKNDITIKYTPTFVKSYKKLPQIIRKKAEKNELVFIANIFDPSLKTHKLSGKLENYWSFSINYQYRIVFRFLTSHEILLVDVDTHSVYK